MADRTRDDLGDPRPTPGTLAPNALPAQTFADLPEGVTRVEGCDLLISHGRWDWAEARADAIERLWRQRQAERPQLFNGRIFLLRGADIVGGRLRASFVETRFACYLYWREAGFPEAGVRDGFGSALIRSGEGHLLYGRQRPGHVNAGLVYPPGGFIDPRDVDDQGRIDIGASIAREVGEETGLPADDFATPAGYWITVTGPHISMAREFRSTLPATELAHRIGAALATDPDPELDGMVVIRSIDDLEASAPHYGRLLAAAVLGAV